MTGGKTCAPGWQLPEALASGVSQLPDTFWQGGWAQALQLEAVPGQERLWVRRRGSDCQVGYGQPAHFFRALGHLRERAGQRDFSLEERMTIPRIGVMVDASRNSVPRVETVCRLLDAMAPMGLNTLILYMEDVYPIEGERRFGYMRGGYRPDDLIRMDRYAARYGIELIPSIQVLGHLEKVLRFEEYAALRDSGSCLLVGDKAADALIERMLAALRGCLSSHTVIVGMDETRGLGEGAARARYGGRPPIELFAAHLERVGQLAARQGFSIAFYSDMLFKYASAQGEYLDPDAAIPPALLARIPAGARPIYWDYYSSDPSLLDRMMQRHSELGECIYAGPLLSVSSFCVQYPATFQTAEPALAAVKRRGIGMAYGCLWHDDGAECDDMLGILGMQLYAEHAYSTRDSLDKAYLDRRLQACTGLKGRWFMDAAALDAVPWINRANRWPPNVCKYALWQDVLQGLFDEDMRSFDFKAHYERAAARLRADLQEAGEAGDWLRVPLQLAEVLAVKCGIGVAITDHYRAQDREALKLDAETLRGLAGAVERLRRTHRARWMRMYAPFGWDRLDLRYGGLLARLDTARARILDYCSGNLERVEELEAPRFPVDSGEGGLGRGIWKVYSQIATLSDG